MTRSGRFGKLGVILFFGIALRLVGALYQGDRVETLPGIWDQVSYDELARRVSAGHGFSFDRDWWPMTRGGEPTAHWSYLYTLGIAGVYRIVGAHPIVVRLLQVVLVGLLTPWLTWRLARRVAGERAALLAAGMSAVYAYFVYYSGALVTESLFICGVLASLECAAALAERSRSSDTSGIVRASLLLGLALAATVLLRQVFLLFVPVLVVWLMVWNRRHAGIGARRTVGAIAPAVTVLALAILPFTIYNTSRFGGFTLLNTNAGFAFYWANHPIHGRSFKSILPEDGPGYADLIPEDLRHLNEAEMDRALMKRGLRIVRDDPLRYAVLSVNRGKDLFKFWPSRTSSTMSNLARVLSFGLLLPLILIGLQPTLGILTRGDSAARWTLLLLLAFAVSYAIIHLLSWSLIRYRLPIDAILMIVGALGLQRILDAMRARRKARSL
jgi:hypothetical protein